MDVIGMVKDDLLAQDIHSERVAKANETTWRSGKCMR
jgi:hypothetical protein